MELSQFRYALRSLRKSPGFVAAAMVSLGLGLALVTTMLGLLDAVVHPYTPYRDPGRLYRVIWNWSPRLSLKRFDVFAAVRAGARSFEAVLPIAGYGVSVLESPSGETRLNVAQVPARFFTMLAVRPDLGRLLTSADAGRDVAVVSREVWRAQFAGRRSLTGATITVAGRVFAIVGVMPRGMDVPFAAAVWVPMSDSDERTGVGLSYLEPFVKLKAGVTRAQADSELAGLARQLTAQYEVRGAPFWLALFPVRADPMQLRDVHFAMLGAALAVLLIACANLANLMLARGLARRREIALRLALGAPRRAVISDLCAESAWLTLGGAGLGALLSLWAAGVLESRVPRNLWFLGIVQPQLSWRVFGASLVVAAAAALIFGLVPALRVVKAVNLDEPLKDGAGTTARQRQRYSGLVIAEVALSLALLMGAGLLLRVVHHLATYQYNFPARQLLWTYVRLGGLSDTTGQATGPQDRVRPVLSVVAAFERVPGVAEAAAQVQHEPPGKAVTAEMAADSNRLLDAESYPLVTPTFLRTMGLPVLEGRDFADGDLAGNGAVILNAVAAQRLYPHESPVGHMLKLGAPNSDAPWVPIVGVCRAALTPGPGELIPRLALPEIYVVRSTNMVGPVDMLIRAAGDPVPVAVAAGRELRTIAPGSAFGVYPFLYELQTALAAREFLAQLFVTMALFALILAAVGVYGVLSYAVSRRLREFAVRIALGALRGDVLRAVLHDGFVMTLAGTALGGFLALWSSFLLDAFLEDVYPTDAVTLVVSEAVLVVAAAAACLGPALRATRADPIAILRAT